MAGLSPKQQRFVEEYLVDLNGTQAAIRAGYSESNARSQASRMLSNVNIQEAIAEGAKARSKRTKIDQDWVIDHLVENVKRAMQETPVLRDGNPTGEYQYQGAVANRALELLGKHFDEAGIDDRLRAIEERLGLT